MNIFFCLIINCVKQKFDITNEVKYESSFTSSLSGLFPSQI